MNKKSKSKKGKKQTKTLRSVNTVLVFKLGTTRHDIDQFTSELNIETWVQLRKVDQLAGMFLDVCISIIHQQSNFESFVHIGVSIADRDTLGQIVAKAHLNLASFVEAYHYDLKQFHNEFYNMWSVVEAFSLATVGANQALDFAMALRNGQIDDIDQQVADCCDKLGREVMRYRQVMLAGIRPRCVEIHDTLAVK